MDTDRDGYVDEEELVSGVRQMFPSAKTAVKSVVATDGRSVAPAALFM